MCNNNNVFTATCVNVNCSSNENCVDLENGGQCQCNDGYEKDEANICQSWFLKISKLYKL